MMSAAGLLVRFADRSALAETQPEAGGCKAQYVYQRAPDCRRDAYIGPSGGPDAAVTHLRDVVELELQLLGGPARSSSTFRIIRRSAAKRRR
jgi:hypothetical protein